MNDCRRVGGMADHHAVRDSLSLVPLVPARQEHHVFFGDIMTIRPDISHSPGISPHKDSVLPQSIPAFRKPGLIGLSREQLNDRLAEIGIAGPQRNMRINQLWNWIYVRGASEFAAMTSMSKTLRNLLDEQFTLERPKIINRQISEDGTRKWLLQTPALGSGDTPATFECVFIPDTDRGALCVSSQVGCTLNCSFCHTGTQRLVRNLTPEEIVGQIMIARDEIGDWPGNQRREDELLPNADRMITNIVLMGMGEPLYNFDNVRAAMTLAADDNGLNFSRRRITLSTAGVIPGIARWGQETGTMLAISLHATHNALRNILVPINKKYPIEELLAACRAYPGLSNARRITFEYVMLKDVNDSEDDARALSRLLAGIPAKINLIPFNPWPGSQYECSDPEQIERFARIIKNAGYASPVRTPRGRDIMAACGQLKSASEKRSARERKAMAEP